MQLHIHTLLNRRTWGSSILSPPPQEPTTWAKGRCSDEKAFSRVPALQRSWFQHLLVYHLWLNRLLKPYLLVPTAKIVYSNREAVNSPSHRVQELQLRRGHPQLNVLLLAVCVPGHEGGPVNVHGCLLGSGQIVVDLAHPGQTWSSC